jgi:CTP:molybdopterin cytidylyltransferase MocA
MDIAPTPAVVLAAGYSRRLGRPKALVDVNGKELVRWIHERLVSVGCRPVVVVVNAEIESEVANLLPEAHLVVNPNPDAGRTGSLQLGIEALAAVMETGFQRLVMAPVDRPGWNIEVLQALLEHKGDSAPCHDGRKGHPVLLSSPAIHAVRKAGSHLPLRDVVLFKPVAVSGPWLHLNIDTESDVLLLESNEAALLACFSQGEGI